MNRLITAFVVPLALSATIAFSSVVFGQEIDALTWEPMTALPDDLGVAGPFVGTHAVQGSETERPSRVLIVAGGANFPTPIWEREKVWRDTIYVGAMHEGHLQWKVAGKLPRPLAYGAAVSTADGVICIGGNDARQTFADCFLLHWNPKSESIERIDYPRLPKPCAFGAASIIDQTIYLSGGQSGASLETAMNQLWSLDLSMADQSDAFAWQELPPLPGPARALNLTVAQNNGDADCVYVVSGRRQADEGFDLLKDAWEYNPPTRSWRKRSDSPRCLMAASALGLGESKIYVFGGDDGKLFGRADELKDDHPGFIRRAIAYDAAADQWIDAGAIPSNQVTTIAVKWDGTAIITSGEVRPRVRTPAVYRVRPVER